MVTSRVTAVLSQSEASCGSRDISPTNGRPRHTRDTPHHVTCSLSITSHRTKKIGYMGNMHLLIYIHTATVRSEFLDRHRTRHGLWLISPILGQKYNVWNHQWDLTFSLNWLRTHGKPAPAAEVEAMTQQKEAWICMETWNNIIHRQFHLKIVPNLGIFGPGTDPNRGRVWQAGHKMIYSFYFVFEFVAHCM